MIRTPVCVTMLLLLAPPPPAVDAVAPPLLSPPAVAAGASTNSTLFPLHPLMRQSGSKQPPMLALDGCINVLMIDNLQGGASVPLTILEIIPAWHWMAPPLDRWEEVEEEEEEEEGAYGWEKVWERYGTAPSVMLSAQSQIKSKVGASLMGAAMVLQIWVYKVLSQVAIL